MKRSVLFSAFAALSLTAACSNALAVGGLTDITIYDRTEGRTLPVYWHDGKAFVAGKPGNEYQLMLKNQAGQDVLAIVSVDGVNVISGETASQNQSGYMIATSSTMDIKGWRTSIERTAAFYFTTLPDSYATRTGRPDNVGVIGAALFRRKPVAPPVAIIDERRYEESDRQSNRGMAGALQAPRSNSPMPSMRADASSEIAKEKKAEQGIGTGYGRNETSYAQYTAFDRATSTAEETVTIYYDSYHNLVARGIIPPATPPRCRKPEAFPANFVPEPPRRW